MGMRWILHFAHTLGDTREHIDYQIIINKNNYAIITYLVWGLRERSNSQLQNTAYKPVRTCTLYRILNQSHGICKWSETVGGNAQSRIINLSLSLSGSPYKAVRICLQKLFSFAPRHTIEQWTQKELLNDCNDYLLCTLTRNGSVVNSEVPFTKVNMVGVSGVSANRYRCTMCAKQSFISW